MALIRLQNKVPNIYVDESRDFQLLCRLFDVIFNGIKYDIDGIERLDNSLYCKSTVLQLLQTKLGFFTDKDFTDTTLRYILRCFPILVKKKGSLLAIEQAVYMFLKINGLETRIEIDIIDKEPTAEQRRLYGMQVTDHCIVIGIESEIRDITPLKEVLKYIIPFGYNLFFYFFVGEATIDTYTSSQQINMFLVSDDVNDMMGNTPVAYYYEDPTKILGQVFEYYPNRAYSKQSLDSKGSLQANLLQYKNNIYQILEDISIEDNENFESIKNKISTEPITKYLIAKDWIEAKEVLASPDADLPPAGESYLHIMYYRPTKTAAEVAKGIVQIYSKYYVIPTFNSLTHEYSYDWKLAGHSTTIEEVSNKNNTINNYALGMEQRQIAAINTVEAVYDESRPGRQHQAINILGEIVSSPESLE